MSKSTPAKIRPSATIQIELGHDLLGSYRKAAIARQTTIPRLVRDIVTFVGNDALFDAVLDDADE
jgi:hypothetical protein